MSTSSALVPMAGRMNSSSATSNQEHSLSVAFCTITLYREIKQRLDFRDAVDKAYEIAVDEMLPQAKLMPVGKLRQFRDVPFGSDSDEGELNSEHLYRVNAVKGKLD